MTEENNAAVLLDQLRTQFENGAIPKLQQAAQDYQVLQQQHQQYKAALEAVAFSYNYTHDDGRELHRLRTIASRVLAANQS